MKKFFEERGYEVLFTKPVMNGYTPWRIAALDYVNPVFKLDTGILQECVEGYLADILKGLPKGSLDTLEVYDMFTAVNGAACVAYVDSMNRQTSAGNPWKKSKKHFLEKVPPKEGTMDPVMPTPEILDRSKVIEEKYRSGRRAHPNFCAHLKDEPVTLAKAGKGKTRVFTGAPFDWSLVVRKYLLSFIRLLQNNRFVFEAGPGTIAQSSEWGDIYRYLTTFGEDRIVAGDYKSFDKRMPATIILAAFEVMYRLCELSGKYDHDDLMCIRGIATDTAFPLVDFNGDLVEFYGSNPSGHPLTVIVNSLANSLYMRYCYLCLNPQRTCEDFQERVKLMTYGDDNIMGISPEAPWFNHTTIQATLAEIDITYTMADKEAESVPYIPIDDATFLKRKWRFEKELGDYACPLDHQSIEKMLTVWVRSRTISESEQMVAVISAAVREYFFYGRETFVSKVKLLKEAVSDHGMSRYVVKSTFPTWHELVTQWKEASKAVRSK
jgi:hypothetical protein